MLVLITPQAAGWLLQFCKREETRKPDMDVVTAFARRIIGGQFETTPPIRFSVSRDIMRLQDGQHRLCGIIEAAEAVDLEVEFDLEVAVNPVSAKIFLVCPRCGQTVSTPRAEYDPPAAIKAEQVCPACTDALGGGFEPETFYYDVEGRELHGDPASFTL